MSRNGILRKAHTTSTMEKPGKDQVRGVNLNDFGDTPLFVLILPAVHALQCLTCGLLPAAGYDIIILLRRWQP